MDFPEGARVLNISIDLSVGARANQTPVEAYFRVIDQPVLRLVSVDLKASAEITTIAEVFDFARDYLGLLKAAVIASGMVPPGLEGATQPLADVLARLTGRAGHGIEIVSKVNDIPKGSRLAVSTSLLASLIAVCMRATSQIHSLTGGMEEHDRRLVAARAILGEWLAGSGGGWQDSAACGRESSSSTACARRRAIRNSASAAGGFCPTIESSAWPRCPNKHARSSSRASCWYTAEWRRTWAPSWRW